MRLLHTSDWHLGRSFHGGSLQDEQEAMIDRIVAVAVDQRVDAVLVAGDLYDRAIPPLDALGLFEDAVARLRATGATVVAISGNHDSPRRVSVHDRLLEPSGVSIRGDIRRLADPVVVSPAHGARVAIYPIPYLDPVSSEPVLDELDASHAGDAAADSPPRRGGHEATVPATTGGRPGHDAVTRHALRRVRSDIARRRLTSVVIAHTFVTGGVPSESERDLSVGDLDHVAIDAFEGFDYVALGHLHGPQQFAGGRVTYSGSPLPYSFSEEHHRKSVRVVDLADDGRLDSQAVLLGVGRRLRSLRGSLDSLVRDPTLADAEACRVRAVLTDTHLPVHAMARLRRRFPHTVELRHEPDGVAPAAADLVTGSHVREATPIELLRGFWTDQHGAPPSSVELDLMTEAIAERTSAVP